MVLMVEMAKMEKTVLQDLLDHRGRKEIPVNLI
jgi:hypothetical protein